MKKLIQLFLILFASVLLSSCGSKEEISNSNLTIKLNEFPQELNELGDRVSAKNK